MVHGGNDAKEFGNQRRRVVSPKKVLHYLDFPCACKSEYYFSLIRIGSAQGEDVFGNCLRTLFSLCSCSVVCVCVFVLVGFFFIWSEGVNVCVI